MVVYAGKETLKVYKRVKCTKYETCAILYRFYILYILCNCNIKSKYRMHIETLFISLTCIRICTAHSYIRVQICLFIRCRHLNTNQQMGQVEHWELYAPAYHKCVVTLKACVHSYRVGKRPKI